MKRALIGSLVAAALMVGASGLATAMKPGKKVSAQLGKVDLEAMIPTRIGDWVIDHSTGALVVNPQQEAMLSRLYSQTLSRIYVNPRSGETVMLSIAYGEDQRDAMQLHYPEVCYPAQGFALLSKRVGTLATAAGPLPVKQLVTALGSQRIEPVTYWVMIGEQATTGGWRKKVAEMRYGLNGLVADGLLVRVSSIEPDAAVAFRLHERFVQDLSDAVMRQYRARLFGAAGEMPPAQGDRHG
jgi:EpsI family protein